MLFKLEHRSQNFLNVATGTVILSVGNHALLLGHMASDDVLVNSPFHLFISEGWQSCLERGPMN